MALKFTKDHEWIRTDGDFVVVGISDYAQKALGDLVSLELPKVGRVLKQHDSFSIVDSMKASSDVYAPISGEVVEINSPLNNNPQWINESPYEKGWMIKIKPSNPAELDVLMSEEDYKKYLSGLGSH
ncbi:MAG: glycine cleavage system protein GcvH [Candidatus Micrarchaeota archaeon]|nr:glycine cleavage system protein GcvH [Candidatus Micrarchaeota archaeon]